MTVRCFMWIRIFFPGKTCYVMALSVLRLCAIEWTDMMVIEWGVGKEAGEACCTALVWNLSGGTAEKCWKSQPGWLMYRPKFEPSTSQVYAKTVVVKLVMKRWDVTLHWILLTLARILWKASVFHERFEILQKLSDCQTLMTDCAL